MASCAWCRSGTEVRVSKGEEEAPVSAEENEALVRRYFEEGGSSATWPLWTNSWSPTTSSTKSLMGD